MACLDTPSSHLITLLCQNRTDPLTCLPFLKGFFISNAALSNTAVISKMTMGYLDFSLQTFPFMMRSLVKLPSDGSCRKTMFTPSSSEVEYP